MFRLVGLALLGGALARAPLAFQPRQSSYSETLDCQLAFMELYSVPGGANKCGLPCLSPHSRGAYPCRLHRSVCELHSIKQTLFQPRPAHARHHGVQQQLGQSHSPLLPEWWRHVCGDVRHCAHRICSDACVCASRVSVHRNSCCRRLSLWRAVLSSCALPTVSDACGCASVYQC